MKAPKQEWVIEFRTMGVTSVTVRADTEGDARDAAWIAFESEPRDAEWEIDHCTPTEACTLSGEPLDDCRMCDGAHCEAHPRSPCDCGSEERHLTLEERGAR